MKLETLLDFEKMDFKARIRPPLNFLSAFNEVGDFARFCKNVLQSEDRASLDFFSAFIGLGDFARFS